MRHWSQTDEFRRKIRTVPRDSRKLRTSQQSVQMQHQQNVTLRYTQIILFSEFSQVT